MSAEHVEQFRDAMRESGMEPPEYIEPGRLHRFSPTGKRGDDAAWCKMFPDMVGGVFGDFRTGFKGIWQAERERPFTDAERETFRQRCEAERREREAEEKRRHAEAREKAAAIWKESNPAPGDHPYLARKRVKPNGTRIYDGALVIALRDASGEIHSLQFIDDDGNKKFLSGGRVAGCYFAIGEDPAGASALCVAEGFATSASIHQATGYPVAVALNAGNLEAVARALRAKFPDITLILCADDDVATAGNPGLSKAAAAAELVGGKLAVPDFGSERPKAATDFNDMAAHLGAQAVARAIDAAMFKDRLGGHERADPQPTKNAYPYGVENGRIVRYRQTKEGAIIDSLCNFDAQIRDEIILDDGADQTRAFVIEGSLDSGVKLPGVRIPASRFSGMAWVTECWGMRAVVRAGNGTRDFLREAIQRLSPEARTHHIFTHTGWRKIGAKWIYLSGSTSGTNDYEVDLGPELARYKLPSSTADEVDAMRLSLSLLGVAPLRITAPLFAACYRAPLISAFPQDLSLWMEGKTGSMKSTLAALFLNHFGNFDRLHLPGAWVSTANQLERRAFLLKDNLFVIDDYAPTGLDHREMELKASRLLRAQGNLAGRARLKSDLTERSAFYPRGIVISTGEQHPPGQSLLARTLVIELGREDINVPLLTELQQHADRLGHAMAGYIGWLAPQMDDIPGLLRESFNSARDRAAGGGEHLRIPEASAHLWLGLHCALTYAQEIRATDEAEATRILNDAWSAFIQIGREQALIVEEEAPSKRFLNVLITMLTQRRAVIVSKDEGTPDFKPGSVFIGWYDDEWLFLLPEATFSTVVRFCRDSGELFPIRQERLKKDLAKSGLSKTDTGRLTATVRFGVNTKRILQLNVPAVEKLLGVTGVTTSHQCHHFRMGERDGL